MKLKLAFGIASAAMLLCACGDDLTSADDVKPKGMVTLKVVDYNTGEALDSAEIYSLIDAKVTYTDTLGTASWEDNVIGDYEYTIAKDGYATRTAKVTLQENSGGDMARVEDRIQEVKMFRKGVAVKGTVLIRDPHTGNLSAAPKVKVVLSYENDFIVPSEITTRTDSSGVYEFTNLAEGLEYSVRVPQATVDGKTYAWENQKIINQALRSGERRVLDQVTMEVVGLDPELINDNLSSIEQDESAMLTFSTELLADSVPTSWKVYKGAVANANDYYIDDFGNIVYYNNGNRCSAGTSVLTSATLDEDGKTVVISPISEKWTRLATYCISGIVYTGEGKSIAVSKTFVPGSSVSRPGLVTQLAAEDYFNRFVMLSWKPTGEEIKGYRVYFKANESADFEEYKAWSTNPATIPVDSSSCKKVQSQAACAQYGTLGSANRTETNYWWYTDSVGTQVTAADYYTYVKYNYVWTTKNETITCNVPYGDSYTSCEAYTLYGSYDDYEYDYDTDSYNYIWYASTALAKPDTCVKLSNEGSTSYTTCPQYTQYGKTYNTMGYEYFNMTYTDSIACTVSGQGDYTYDIYGNLVLSDSYATNAKCMLLEEQFGRRYRSTSYNYWWYTEYVPVKPDASSDRAFVTVNNVVSSQTTSVKFIVLPYVVVGGDTVLADALSATPAEYKVGEGN